MKNKKPFVWELILGSIMIIIGFFFIKTDYYSTMLFSMGIGLSFASGVQLFKIYYYKMPRHKEEYECKKKEEYINSVDERKIFLRMKAGSLTYQLMTFVLLAVSFTLALFRVNAWIIAMIFGLFIFQTILGFVIYKYLQKKL